MVNVHVRTADEGWRSPHGTDDWKVMDGVLYLYTAEGKIFHAYAPGYWREISVPEPWKQE